MIDIDNLKTCDEVAEILHIKVRTVREHIHRGRLRASKFGKAYLISAEAVAELIKLKEYQPKLTA